MLKILIVDDEKDDRDKMIKSINHKENGFIIIDKASDGLEAIPLIRKLLPDIVLMDIEMPGMSGLEVIKIVRSENLPTVFIVISAYDKFEYARDCIRLEVEDYVLKPCLPTHICNAVYRASKNIPVVKFIPFSHEELTTAIPSSSLEESVFKSDNMLLRYPYDIECILIDNLTSGSNQETYSNFDKFLNAVRSLNKSPTNIINCYIILYVEILRTIIDYNMDLSSLRAYISEFAVGSVEDFEKMLLGLCDKVLKHFIYNEVSIEASDIVTARAIDYINKHLTDELTLEQVAKEIYVSPSYLSRSFTNSLSISFTNYINNVRIDNAIRIITERPHLKNYEIADMIGYKSTKYFGQVFKSIKGVTISQFKRSILSNNVIGKH